MADWGYRLDDVMDGMSLPQFRLLSEMRRKRIAEERRWQLQLTSFSIQSEEQAEAMADLLDSLQEFESGEPARAEMGGGFTISKRYPLLHELTPADVAASPRLRRIVRFRTVTEE